VNKIWEQAFSELQLSPAHAYLLRLVIAQPGISQQTIASELKLEKSTVTRFIESLNSKGYITRIKSGREQLIHPSDKSKNIAIQLEQQGQYLYEHMMNDLGKESLIDLVTDIKKTNQRLE